MNPYDFVRIDWQRPPQRRPFTHHGRLEGWAGRIEGEIVAETPIFIPRKGNQQPQPFLTNWQGTPILPGSSLKGLFRSVAETVGPGCWRLFSGKYSGGIDYAGKLPAAFWGCRNLQAVCSTCRLFGMVAGGKLLLGNVSFEDALATSATTFDPMFTPVLDMPKPRHEVWYVNGAGGTLSGRKFYFHQGSVQREASLRRSTKGQLLNQHILPLNTGSAFAMRLSFTNLEEDELALLVYALVLEQQALGQTHEVLHKLGYAKPAGLGSVRVRLTRLERWHAAARYTGEGQERYEGSALTQWIKAVTQPYASSNSITLQDLRRIWRWPPQRHFQYPGQAWFRANPQAPISQTP